MSNALQDLDALMIKAKDMVRLAAELNEKLTAVSSPTSTSSSTSTSTSTSTLVASIPESTVTVMSTTATEPEEATFIRSSLSQLGLQMSNAPVTLDMIKDEKRWFEELAKELAGVLQGAGSRGRGRGGDKEGLMRERGIIALDEVWGGWNRARGVGKSPFPALSYLVTLFLLLTFLITPTALIPPQTLLSILPLLPTFTSPPISTRLLSSQLRVLHTPQYTHLAFSTRLINTLREDGPKSAMEVSKREGLTIGMVVEMVGAVEGDGTVCRDVESEDGEVRWWWNVFEGYVWDGQE